MPTAQDLANQKREAERQVREVNEMRQKQKRLLSEQITDYDRQIAALQTLRSKTASDLSTLG
jgi:hypothetical protein